MSALLWLCLWLLGPELLDLVQDQLTAWEDL